MRFETRKDKYGQVVRVRCSCGETTNWHQEKWKALQALNDRRHNCEALRNKLERLGCVYKVLVRGERVDDR